MWEYAELYLGYQTGQRASKSELTLMVYAVSGAVTSNYAIEELSKVMAELGLNSWELVSVSDSFNLDLQYQETRYYFKRRILP